MNVRLTKLELAGVEKQLERIADMLEQLLYATNPPNLMTADPEDNPEKRIFYTDEAEEIIRYKLARMGKEYKPKR